MFPEKYEYYKEISLGTQYARAALHLKITFGLLGTGDVRISLGRHDAQVGIACRQYLESKKKYRYVFYL